MDTLCQQPAPPVACRGGQPQPPSTNGDAADNERQPASPNGQQPAPARLEAEKANLERPNTSTQQGDIRRERRGLFPMLADILEKGRGRNGEQLAAPSPNGKTADNERQG
jgi:hypothetical protein